MQIKDNYLNRKAGVWIWAKVGITALAVFFIYNRFQNQEISLKLVEWPDRSFRVIAVVVLLMVVNWSLEAFRWKVSVKVFEQVNFYESLKMVLGGLALNWVLPFTTGDAIFRLAQLKDRYHATSAMIINRGILLAITIFYGLTSINFYSADWIDFNVFAIGIPLIIVLILGFFRKRLSRFFDYFKQIEGIDILLVSGISVLRYTVFVFQFFLLLDLFLPEASAKILLLGIGWIFFFRSVLPSILGGVGVREASGLIFFSEVSDPTLVIIPVFIIWVINNAIPSIFGLAAIYSARLKPS